MLLFHIWTKHQYQNKVNQLSPLVRNPNRKNGKKTKTNNDNMTNVNILLEDGNTI